MTRILSSDLLIADVIVSVSATQELRALVEHMQLRAGGKYTIDESQLKAFESALRSVPEVVAPGGSSANLLTTLSKLLRKEVEIRFVGVVGEGAHYEMVRQALRESQVGLIPEHIPHGVRTSEARSYVLVYPDGQVTTATFPGNAKQVLRPALLPEHVVEHSDVVLMQGSLWRKLHAEFVERLYYLTRKHACDLWLTLPTQYDLTSQEAQQFLEVLEHAALVFGNMSELTRLFNCSFSDAVGKLQRLMRLGGRNTHDVTAGLAYITLGARGCVLVTRDVAEEVPAILPEGMTVQNTIGAGDTAYAGFAAGYLKRLPLRDAAQLGMLLAGEKVTLNHTRLPDPLGSLKRLSPRLAEALS